MAALLCILILIALPLAWQAFGTWHDRRRYPPPGLIFNGLHIWSTGAAGPSVILESGIAGTSLSWKPVQDRVALFAQVSSYDRAGLGWSHAARTPRSLRNIADELYNLLHSAAIPAPYILVGHSFGALVVREFAANYPQEVAGLVLVDPVPLTDWVPLSSHQKNRLALGVKLSRRGAWLAQFGVVRLALTLLMSGSKAIPKLLARFTAGNGAAITNNLTREVRKLPREVWPMVAAQWCLPKNFRGMAAYLETLPANAADAKMPAGVPSIILTALHGTPEQLPGALHRTAFQTGHWIQLDEPELVVNAIQDLIALNLEKAT